MLLLMSITKIITGLTPGENATTFAGAPPITAVN
jgi:hypothetical protein